MASEFWFSDEQWSKIGAYLPRNRSGAHRVDDRRAGLNPVENVWRYLGQKWLSNTVFETYDAIINAACDAWNKLAARPECFDPSECTPGRMSVSRHGRWRSAPSRNAAGHSSPRRSRAVLVQVGSYPAASK